MPRRTTIWQAAAVLFAALNLAGGIYAAAIAEPLHAASHVALALLGALVWWRLAAPAGAAADGAPLAAELDARLARLERSVDAVAVDVERIGEGQRYVTRVLAADARAAEPAAR
jgi:hypothetical protein